MICSSVRFQRTTASLPGPAGASARAAGGQRRRDDHGGTGDQQSWMKLHGDPPWSAFYYMA